MFKLCPSCRDEFVPTVSVCPDCRVPLVAAEELASAPVARDAGVASAAFTLTSAVMLRRGGTGELQDLARRLAEHGVRCVIDTDPPGARIAGTARTAAGREVQLAIYVDEADSQTAARLHHEWVLATVPGASEAQLGGVLDACPGCGEPLATNASACSSCGLEFPPLETTCPQCGQPVAVDAERCTSCGYQP
jgi:hypothetical protein